MAEWMVPNGRDYAHEHMEDDTPAHRRLVARQAIEEAGECILVTILLRAGSARGKLGCRSFELPIPEGRRPLARSREGITQSVGMFD